MITVLRLHYDVVNLCKSVAKRFMSTQKSLSPGWIKLANYEIYPWSVSGVETCVVIKQGKLRVAFDIGYACRESVPCDHIFISHGHLDHVSGITQHASKRGLYRMMPARYYTCVELKKPLLNIGQLFTDISELELSLHIFPVKCGQQVQLPGNRFVVPFPTLHRVVSQGYILYQKYRTLKEQYRNMPANEIQEFQRQGHEIHDTTIVPEVAYTGDTIFDLFKNPPLEDLLKVRLLITEMTYIHQSQKKDMVAMARDRGHIHLSEVIQNAHLFRDVGALLFIHFSDRYSEFDIEMTMKQYLPDCLKDKVYVACLQNNRPVIKGFAPYSCVLFLAHLKELSGSYAIVPALATVST